MRSKVLAFCASLFLTALSLTAVVYADGGFPSFPIFRSIGVQQSPFAYPWGTTPHIQINPTVAILTPQSNGSIELAANCYFNGAQWHYMTSSSCAVWDINQTSATLYTAPSGTAGNLANLTVNNPWPQVYSAVLEISGTCVVFSQKPAGWITSCTYNSSTNVAPHFSFPAMPACVVAGNSASASPLMSQQITTSSDTIFASTALPAAISIICLPQS